MAYESIKSKSERERLRERERERERERLREKMYFIRTNYLLHIKVFI